MVLGCASFCRLSIFKMDQRSDINSLLIKSMDVLNGNLVNCCKSNCNVIWTA